MTKQQKKELQRSIIEFENPYPKDDLISSYSDYMNVRDFLSCYQFNPIVFEKLLHIANTEWTSTKRRNRLLMLNTIKLYFNLTQNSSYHRYYSRQLKPNIELSLDTRKLLFGLFRKTFEDSIHISPNQIGEARIICNNILLNLELTPTEEKWLCSHVSKSQFILNRVLRYPIKSDEISHWAKNNFDNNLIRGRRAELLSWMIDQNPDFEIDKQTLIDDFDFLNQCDLQAIQNYDDENAAYKIMQDELEEYLPKIEYLRLDGSTYQGDSIELSVTELKLAQRPYKIPTVSSKKYPVEIPDFKKMNEEFYALLETHQKTTMIWAIAYSRLDNAHKSMLFQKYYSSSTYAPLYKVCKRTQNTDMLKWMLAQQ